MKIQILYFAILADQARKAEESIETESTSIEELYLILKEQYGFKLSFSNIQVAINHEMGNKEADIKDGDIVAFLPPMAGG